MRSCVLLIITAILGACSGKDGSGGSSGSSTPAQAAQSGAASSVVEGFHTAVSHYRLTDDNVKRTQDAMIQINKLSASDPNLASTIEHATPSDSTDESLDQIAARMDAIPQMKSVLSSAGISSKDYLLTLVTLMETGPAYDMKKAGMLPPDSQLAKDVSPANMDWVAAHQAQVKAFVDASNRDK